MMRHRCALRPAIRAARRRLPSHDSAARRSILRPSCGDRCASLHIFVDFETPRRTGIRGQERAPKYTRPNELPRSAARAVRLEPVLLKSRSAPERRRLECDVRNGRVTIVSVLVVSWLSGGTLVRAENAQRDCEQKPDNIEVARTLQPVFAQALTQSPTVQRQCQLIAAAPHVRIAVRLQVGRLPGGSRAEATISRYEAGALFAEIRLPVSVNLIEMLAHELEHVIEQMEGISLAQLADERQNGVARLADGAFETRRAQIAGRAAAHEVGMFERAERQTRAEARALRRKV